MQTKQHRPTPTQHSNQPDYGRGDSCWAVLLRACLVAGKLRLADLNLSCSITWSRTSCMRMAMICCTCARPCSARARRDVRISLCSCRQGWNHVQCAKTVSVCQSAKTVDSVTTKALCQLNETVESVVCLSVHSHCQCLPVWKNCGLCHNWSLLSAKWNCGVCGLFISALKLSVFACVLKLWTLSQLVLLSAKWNCTVYTSVHCNCQSLTVSLESQLTMQGSVANSLTKTILVAHSKPCFPAYSSKLCQNWLYHWWVSLYLYTAVHWHRQCPPKGSGTNKQHSDKTCM